MYITDIKTSESGNQTMSTYGKYVNLIPYRRG
jgi:hypothetical protein